VGPEIDELFGPALDPFCDPPLGAPPDAELDAASTRAGAARAPSRPSTAIILRNLMDVISKSAQSICYAGSGKGNVNPLSKGGGKNGQHDGLRTSLRRMRGDMRTRLPSGDTVPIRSR
jgi:hypothetical protein